MKAYSRDIRWRIVKAHQNSEGSLRQLAARFDVSLSFVRDLLRQFRETGSIDPKPHRGGRTRKIDEAGRALLSELLNERPGATLSELCEHFARRSEVRASRATVHRVVRELKARRRQQGARATRRA